MTTSVIACIGLSTAVLGALPHAQTRTFDLLTASVDDIQAAVDAGKLTYERLVQLYVARIEAYDRRGPHLRAVIEINPRAVEIARELDEERRARGKRSALHGIPIAVKDNIDVSDLPSTGGNLLFAKTRPAHDATVVQRLRQAGAIVFLKTNLDELALGSRGLSSLGGQVLNPYNLGHNPGGSSGGTAVAVSVGFATLGVATETGFSIRSPASNSSIVGIAPSRGLVSRAGVMPISFTQDRVGVHAKTVRDAALLLEALRGFDASDLATSASLGRAASGSLADVDQGGLKGARLGVFRDLFRKGEQFEPINRSIQAQLGVLRDHGATLLDALSTGEDLIALMPTLRVNGYELRSAFDAYLLRRGPPSPVKTFADLVASGTYLKGGTLERRFSETMKAGALNTNAEYHARLDHQRRVQRLLVRLMEEHEVDALLYPVKSLAAPPIGSSDDGERDNNISAVTGLPAIVVPAGMTPDGFPIALEILGRPFAEARLLAIAHGYERISRARVAPSTTPHLPGEVFPF